MKSCADSFVIKYSNYKNVMKIIREFNSFISCHAGVGCKVRISTIRPCPKMFVKFGRVKFNFSLGSAEQVLNSISREVVAVPALNEHKNNYALYMIIMNTVERKKEEVFRRYYLSYDIRECLEYLADFCRVMTNIFLMVAEQDNQPKVVELRALRQHGDNNYER